MMRTWSLAVRSSSPAGRDGYINNLYKTIHSVLNIGRTQGWGTQKRKSLALPGRGKKGFM